MNRAADRVAPFYAVEINRLANARERRGLPVIHMEVGQPSAGAPAAAIAAGHRALDGLPAGLLGERGARRAPRAALPRRLRPRDRSHADHSHDGRIGCARARDVRAVRPRRAGRRAAARLPGASQCPARARARAGRVRLRRRDALPADGGDDRGARPGAGGTHPDEPVESDRNDDPGRGARRHCRGLRTARHPHPLGRDLPRDRVWRPRAFDPRARAGCRRRQHVLEILVHDGLAARLGRRAGVAGRRDAPVRGEPLPRAADAFAARRARGDGRDGRARVACRNLRQEPLAAGGCARRIRHRADRAAGRRVLPLCGRRRLHARLARLVPRAPRRHRRRAQHGPRLRRRPRRSLRADLVRRVDGGGRCARSNAWTPGSGAASAHDARAVRLPRQHLPVADGGSGRARLRAPGGGRASNSSWTPPGPTATTRATRPTSARSRRRAAAAST